MSGWRTPQRAQCAYGGLALLLLLHTTTALVGYAPRFRRNIDTTSCWENEIFVRCGVERRCEPSCANGGYLPKECPLDMHATPANKHSMGAMLTCSFARCVCAPGYARAYDWACQPADTLKCTEPDSGRLSPFVWPPRHIDQQWYEYLESRREQQDESGAGRVTSSGPGGVQSSSTSQQQPRQRPTTSGGGVTTTRVTESPDSGAIEGATDSGIQQERSVDLPLQASDAAPITTGLWATITTGVVLVGRLL